MSTYWPMGLRLLHCYKAFPPVLGGIELHVEQVARGLHRRGHDVEVVTTAGRDEAGERDEDGVRVRRHRALLEIASTPLSAGLVTDLVRRTRGRRDAPDLIHLHAPYPLAELAWLAATRSARRPPTVVTYHADIVRQRRLGALHRPVQRRMLRRAEAVVATTASYRRSSPQLAGLPRCEVIPLGVDTERFAASAPRPPGLGHFVLFVGRLRHYKGVDHLLRAVPHLPPELAVVIAGDGPEGPSLRALARDLQLGERVRFLGTVPDRDLAGLYQHASALVLPAVNRAEAFGLVQLEAMASGTPVVSTRLGTGVDEVNQDGVTGLTVPVAEPRALAEAVARLVADPALANRLGAAGQARASEHFALEAVLDRLEALYAGLVARGAVTTGR